MKKKIKDLTLEERQKVCEQHEKCKDCPLAMGYSYMSNYIVCLGNKLEREVEVDE